MKRPVKRQAGKAFLCLAEFFFASLSVCEVKAVTIEDYVTIKDGHLSQHGQRVRFWGVNMTCVGDRESQPKRYQTDYATIDSGVRRLKTLGFNAVRFWANNYEFVDEYKKGDRSRCDYNDYFFARLKEEGFAVWLAGLNFGARDKVTPAEVSAVNDPVTAEAWKAAVVKLPQSVTAYLARAWDPRLRELGKRQLKQFLDHYNPYTEKHFYEDPVIAVWELSNEEWWIPKMLHGDWANEPEFFQRQLRDRWNGWLKKKYGGTAKLRKAWSWICDEESVEKGNVAFAPMSEGEVDFLKGQMGPGPINQTEVPKQSRDRYPHTRSEDVVQFIVELAVEYKKDLESFIRGYGKEGIGCRIVPILYDTGMGNQLQNAYLHAQAPATCGGDYVNQTTAEKQDPRYPWASGLLESPRMYSDIPWLENNRVEGRPHLIYEINIFNPSKYRVEFPLRVAALASIQDWDWVNWYVLDGFPDVKLKDPYTHRLNYSYDEYNWNGIHFCYDEVLTAAMKSAGEMFRHFALKPAPRPTVFRFGKKALYDMDMQHYRGFRRSPWGNWMHVSEAMGPTAYRYGMRLAFDPASETSLEILGPFVRDRGFQRFIVRPTDQITYNWQQGTLQCDSASAKSVVGFLPATWEFSHGVRLEDIRIDHPPGQSYVIPGERYAEISITADDGKPLEQSTRITLTALSTSFNEDFKVNTDLYKPMSTANPTAGLAWGEKFAKLFSYGGKVLTSRVGVKVTGDFLKDRKYTIYDWNLNVLKTGTVEGNVLEIPAKMPITFVEFNK